MTCASCLCSPATATTRAASTPRSRAIGWPLHRLSSPTHSPEPWTSTSPPTGTDTDTDGAAVRLRDLWPDPDEVSEVIANSIEPDMFARAYQNVLTGDERWTSVDAPAGDVYQWDDSSTYLRPAPYFDDMTAQPPPVRDIVAARTLVKLGDTVTTDHISPAGAITPESTAGAYLRGLGVTSPQINTFASRRGNHEVMLRGAFANVRLQNQLTPGRDGGWTLNLLNGAPLPSTTQQLRTVPPAFPQSSSRARSAGLDPRATGRPRVQRCLES